MATDKSSDTKRVSDPADLPPSVYGTSPAAAAPASAQPIFTTTIVIEPRWSARLDVSGSYLMTPK